MDERIMLLLKKSLSLTKDPGVYLMKNSKGKVLYIGKAKSLKNRVTSYFRLIEKHTPKVFAMVELVDDFEIIVTDSEFEALVLECSLIKLHAPKYNLLLKDDKGFSYIRVSADSYPRITDAKKILSDNAEYIGPYMSAWVVRQMADEVNKSFGLPTCSRNFPRDFKKGRPCLNLHLGQCMGVCRGGVSEEEYNRFVRQAVETLKGRSADAVKLLTEQMETAALNMEYEQAARCRDRLKAIERFSTRQRMVYSGVRDQDVVAFVQADGDVAVCILKFRDERLVDKLDFIFSNNQDIKDVREEFIPRYYTDLSNDLPTKLVVDDEIEGREILEKLLSEQSSKRIHIHTPKRGEPLKLIDIARLNAAELLSGRRNRTGREVAVLDELKNLLTLPTTPTYIESYDISNIGADTIVGGMVVFENAKPKRSAYKRFKIKDINVPDDYGSMAQMLTRRFVRYIEQADDGREFNILPDLILIDGGKGHVATAKSVLDGLNLIIPVFGMVKDDRHRTRAITDSGKEISISAKRQVFSLITSIQDETHRFAIEYARKSHSKTAFELALNSVKGIGEKRARELFLHFKSKKSILSASIEELCKVNGMTVAAAKAIKEAVLKGEIS